MSWLARLPGSSSRSAVSRRRPALEVEALEDRAVPALTAYSAAFLEKTYVEVLNRPLDDGGRSFWGDKIDLGASHTQVAREILQSPEGRAQLVQSYFTSYLGRSADPQGLAFFVGQLGAGATPEQVQAAILGSAEYVNQNGGTINGFLDSLFQDTLNRSIDAAARAHFTTALNQGATAPQVAEVVLHSAEYDGVFVARQYQAILNRSPDAGGQAFFVNLLQQGQSSLQVTAALLGSDEFQPGASSTGALVLNEADIEALLDRASAASASNDAIIAVVDRGGRILGVRVENGVSPNITNNTANLVYAIDGALAKARTGAFFANNTAPLTSRTVEFISQSTITQREVEAYPSIADPNSTLRGPGYVAPIGTGGHFPPQVNNTPPVDLFGIEHTNRDTTVKNGVVLPERFNVNPAFVPPGAELTPPDSYGFVSGVQPDAQPRGIGTLPGGIPLYKNGELVGGIGVFFPGQTGFATEENSVLGATYNPYALDRSVEAEYMAFVAAGGSLGAGYGFPGPINNAPALPHFNLPSGRIDLAGITLDIFGPGGVQGPQNLVKFGQTLGLGDANGGTDVSILPNGTTLRAGKPVAEGWLVVPHDGTVLNQADVNQLINQGITQALETRAQIRLGPDATPGNSRTRMVFAVTDVNTGEVLGLYRMPDATIFSIDVAVAKGRNAAYYANPGQLQPQDFAPGVLPGVAFTARTFRYLAQPRFPEGINGTFPGPFSIFQDGGSLPTNGLQFGPRLPASAYQSLYGFDSFNPGTNFHQPQSLNQNGVIWFPGSSAVYKDTNGDGFRELVGGAGISGDGVDQDDIVTSATVQNYQPPNNLRADQFFVGGVRLPYFRFPRNPLQ